MRICRNLGVIYLMFEALQLPGQNICSVTLFLANAVFDKAVSGKG